MEGFKASLDELSERISNRVWLYFSDKVLILNSDAQS